MSRKEIDRKFDEIVAFSEIEQFLDTPVKRYSSGMYVRLAFAVAAHLEPEILIVDEVLAVGDMAFQQKCVGKMQDVSRQGRTVIFVSHNMNAVTTLCDRGIFLDQGRVESVGSATQVVQRYSNKVVSAPRVVIANNNGVHGIGSQPDIIEFVALFDQGRNPSSQFEPDSDVFIRIGLNPRCRIRTPRLGLGVTSATGERVFAVASFLGPNHLPSVNSRCVVEARFRLPPLLPGSYQLDIGLSDGQQGFLHAIYSVAGFEVLPVNYLGTSTNYFREMGMIMVRSCWCTSSQMETTDE